MERLRVPFAREGHDLVAPERAPAEVMDLARGQIVEMDLGHGVVVHGEGPTKVSPCA